MQDSRWNAFWTILSLLLICLMIWIADDAISALITFAIGCLFYLSIHLYWLRQLHVWLKNPNINHIPNGSGVWEDIFADIYHQQKKASRGRAQINSELMRFRHAASALPDGVVVLDSDDKIEWCNPIAEAQLGLTVTHDIGQPIRYLIRQEEFVGYLNNNDFSEPIKLKSARHLEITLEIILIPFGSKQKLLISRDVTNLDKIDHMRRDFIANVSHELRTPLTVVGGFLETMMDTPGSVPEPNRKYFDMMQDQTARMKALVEDLLTLSQLESNAKPQVEQAINVMQLVNMILNEANTLSRGRHIISVPVNEPIWLNGAQEELHSAFGNLMTNAIRYTPEGGAIELRWQMVANTAIFSVCDSGIGIEQQHIDRLTERFYRVDRSRSRETGGTGLGLSIVKHILSRHQAKLEVTSEIGKGSTFSAVFPASRIALKA